MMMQAPPGGLDDMGSQVDASQPSDGMGDVRDSENPLIDKASLLKWTTEILGIDVTDFDMLRDGAIFLRLFSYTLPVTVDLNKVEWHANPQTEDEIDANYDILDNAIYQLNIPYTIDRRKAKRGNFSVCYHILVLLFFLCNLRKSSESGNYDDFAYDSAHTINNTLAQFLESDRSMEAMKMGNGRADPEEDASENHLANVGPWLQQQEQVEDAGAQLPPPGTIVEATNMASSPELNGVRGTMLGAADNNRILVDFPPPHGAMLVFPQNLTVVAPPREPPPSGTEVRAVDIPSDLNGQTGIVTGHNVAADGMRVVVEFPPPHGTMLVRPGNLEVVGPVTDTGFAPGAAVEVLDAAALLGIEDAADLDAILGAGRRVLHGIVLEDQLSEEGWVGYRVAALLNGQVQQLPILLRPWQMKSFDQPAGGTGGPDGAHPHVHSKDAWERLSIENVVLREQLQLSQRNTAAKEHRVKALEAKLLRAGMDAGGDAAQSVFPEVDQQALWKDGQAKVKGEAFLTAMKFESESLQRQVELLQQEKDIATTTHEEALTKMRAAFEAEKEILEKQHQSQLNLADVRHRKEAAQLQSQLAAELKNVTAKIKYEEAMMRQGLTESTDALETELLRLRQQKATHEPLLRAMEKTNASLKDLAVRHEERASFEEQARIEIDEHARSLLQSLLTHGAKAGGMDGGAAAGATSIPLQLLLDGQPLAHDSDFALREALVRHVNSALPAGAIVNEFLALAMKIRQLHGELAQKTLEKDAQIEDLRARLNRAETDRPAQPGRLGMSAEFEKDEEIAKLQDQVLRLRKNLDFLREKEKKARSDLESDPHEEHLSGDVVVPSHLVFHNVDGISKSEASMETICAHILQLIQKKDCDALGRCFWILVANNAALQGRVRRAGETIKTLVRRGDRATQELQDQRAAHEKQMLKYKNSERVELEEMCMKTARERAAVEVELKLTQEQLEQAQIQVREGPENLLNNAEFTLQTDEARFKALRTKNKSLKAALGRSRMREEVLLALIQKQRELLHVSHALGASSDPQQVAVLQQKKHQLELEDNGLVQQFNQLPPIDDQGDGDAADEVDRIVQETIDATREQILAVQHNLQSFVECAEASTARIRDMEVEKHSLQFALTNERQLKLQLKAEYDSLLDETTDLKRRAARQDIRDNRELHAATERIRELEDDRATVLIFKEIRGIVAPDHPAGSPAGSPPAAIKAPAAVGSAAVPAGGSTTTRRPAAATSHPPVQLSSILEQRADAAAAAGAPAPRASTTLSAPASALVAPSSRAGSAQRDRDRWDSVARGAASPEASMPQRTSIYSDRLTPKDSTHGLHSKINEARRQIESILASTKMDALQVPMKPVTKGSLPSLPPPSMSYHGSLLDDNEFSKQRHRLLDGYKHATAGAATPLQRGAGTPASVPTTWPDGQSVTR